MKILTLKEIQALLPGLDLLSEIEAGFVAYSAGRAVVPPVGELVLQDPPGDVHIKYGYLRDDEYYVIKIASGFYENPSIGLRSSNGLMLVFQQRTGELAAVLLDEGYLTEVRTAVAGAITARSLAPKSIQRIGILGTGRQARLQLKHLSPITECREVLVWGRSQDKAQEYCQEMQPAGYSLTIASEPNELLQTCNLVVTTTPTTEPLLSATSKPTQGLHITAMGSDTPHKQELNETLLKYADVVVADSISQCLLRGEIHQALKKDAIGESKVVELGSVIAGKSQGRSSESQLTIADLTGVAVQDIQISKSVFAASQTL
jgi:ornithine cyclodeaminase